MRNNFIAWVLISALTLLFYTPFAGPLSKDIYYNAGLFLIPILITLLVPMLLGLFTGGIAYLIARRFRKTFSVTVWIFQVIGILIIIISTIGVTTYN